MNMPFFPPSNIDKKIAEKVAEKVDEKIAEKVDEKTTKKNITSEVLLVSFRARSRALSSI